MSKYLKLIVLLMSVTLLFTLFCTDDPVTGVFNSFNIIPTNLEATDGEYDSVIKVTWNSVSGAKGYNLKRRDDPKVGEFEVITENISDTFYLDTVPELGVKYYYKVNAQFSSSNDTSTYTDLEEGYAGVLDTGSSDTTNDDTTNPGFMVLNASEGTTDSAIILTWTNCGSGFVYKLSAASYEDTAYSVIATDISDTFYIHKNIVPGPYSYRIVATDGSGESLTSTDVGYRTISNLEFFLEVNKTYKYSQAKVGKLNDEDLGKETVGGNVHGTLEYNSYLEGLSGAKAILTYDNYKDFYLTLDGVQSTNIDGLFSKNGNVSDIVYIEGIYPGYVDHHIEVSGGKPSGGYYTIGQPGVDTSDVQFDTVKDDVLY